MTASDPAASPTQPGGAGYQVVARRYRPQRFADLVGQEHVARGLSGAIETGRIGHAYLFTGARGVGKTSAARIYAKALNCEAGPAAEPCNACDACAAITAGQDVDVVEIDAASNRGIDEIRSLRQNVAVRPARGRFKVYIIDEVHMLTREAFNALLKTLEEPPGHVKFVFCTTEPEKLPITILSRCQRFDFVTVESPAIARRLAQIVEAEGAEVTAEALQLIARRAAGSMRDSQSLLEQLLGGAAGPVGVDDVHAVIGTGSEERIGALLAAVAARDAVRAINALDAALAGGADPGGLMEQLLSALRDCLLASVGCQAGMLAGSAGLGIDVVATGRGLGTATILAMLQVIDGAISRMRTSGHAAVLAEMAVVRLATFEDLESLAAAVDRIAATASAASPREKKTPDRSATVSDSAVRSRPVGAAAPPSTEVGRDLPAPGPGAEQVRGDLPPPTGALSPPAEAAGSGAGNSLPSGPPDPLATWRHVAAGLEGLAADFAATATAARWRDDLLEVTLPAEAAAAAGILRRPEAAAAIAAGLERLVGRPLRHTIVLAAADAVEAPVPAARKRPAASQAALVKAAAEHPLVAHARTLFDAAIRKVEPPRPRLPEEAGVGVTATARTADDAAEPDGGREQDA
jgi:DNA polymerase III subunit gamma/tau